MGRKIVLLLLHMGNMNIQENMRDKGTKKMTREDA